MWPSSERLKDPLTAEPMSSWSNPVFAAEAEGDPLTQGCKQWLERKPKSDE